jgi:hypothetical protein
MGMMNAAPAPCTVRAATRAPIVGETAHTADAAVNTKSPGHEHAPTPPSVSEDGGDHQHHRH